MASDTTDVPRPWEDELQRVNSALRVVSKTNKSLNRIDDVITWLNQICQTAVDLGAYRMACVGFIENDERKTVRMVASAGFVAGYLNNITVTWADEPLGRGIGGTAIRTGRVSVVRNIPQDPAFEPWRHQAMQRGYQSAIAIPLTCDCKTFGILVLYAEIVDAFSPAEVEVLQELAGDLAFGVTVVLRTRAERQAASEALRESQRMLQEAQRIAHLAHWERDLRTNVISASDEYFRIFGVPSPKRGLALPRFLEFVHPDERREIARILDDSITQCRDLDLNYRIVRADGQVRFIHSKVHVICDGAGHALRTFGIAQDITEQHEADDALKKANRSLEAKNIALQEVLANIDAQQKKIGRQVAKNIQRMIVPLVHSLRPGLDRRQRHRLEQIERALEEIASPFIDVVSKAVESLSPRELRISSFVSRGLTVKEIAEMEHLSPQTIAAHRRNIRRKLGIANRKINLTTHLRTISVEVPGRE
jgi:PAS domain S-box-containing protein